jgi:hypothetical protein
MCIKPLISERKKYNPILNTSKNGGGGVPFYTLPTMESGRFLIETLYIYKGLANLVAQNVWAYGQIIEDSELRSIRNKVLISLRYHYRSFLEELRKTQYTSNAMLEYYSYANPFCALRITELLDFVNRPEI